jgi:protoheme IX farnesyltransferase
MFSFKPFYEVIKPKQTTLLMITCIVSYMAALGHNTLHNFNAIHFIESCLAVLLAVAGTTALNMWLDSDVDALMPRTKRRPVPSGRLGAEACAIYGLFLFSLGFLLGLKLSLYLALILALGLFLDIIIYTVLLKRKSPYSIVLGGLAGALPSLAGWTAAKGIEVAGIIASAIVFVWIPAHIWYLSIHFEDDYRLARIPMLPLIVGMEKTSWAIVLSVGLMLLLVALLFLITPFGYPYLLISILFTSYFLYKAIKFAISPSRERARYMYKLASITLSAIYMSMLIGSFLLPKDSYI